MASDTEVRMKQRCDEQIAPIDIHRHLLKVYGDDTVDVSTVMRWVVHLNSSEIEVHDKPRSWDSQLSCHASH
jgi:hypothetical protein